MSPITTWWSPARPSPFTLFLLSVRRITPTEAVVASTVEPAVAALVGAVFLGVTLGPAQYPGGALILVAVLLLALRRRPLPDRSPS